MVQPQFVKAFAMRYAALERKLGEIDRARAILTHTAQFCPPARDLQFWEDWRDFEVKHGSVDTVREMFRVKRSVAARFSTTFANFTPAQAGGIAGNAGPALAGQPGAAGLSEDKMQALEREVNAVRSLPVLN